MPVLVSRLAVNVTTQQVHRKLSGLELINLREDAWGSRLGAVSLVAEALASRPHVEQAMLVLATGYRHERNQVRRSRLLREYPAVQVMTTVSVAVEDFRQGSFWPALCDRVGEHGPQVKKDWGDAFLANLKTLGLPDFSDIDDPGLKYVGPILMHSGMPTYCLPDYFRLITERRRQVPDLDPAQFVADVTARAEAGRLHNVDKPVERFLRFGGEFAEDVTDRVFELVDLVTVGANVEDVPLPERFREVALTMWGNGELERVGRYGATRGDADSAIVPRLVLDPFGRGPVLRLPASDTGAGGPVEWTVTIGATVQTVYSESGWPGEPATKTDVPIIAPVRSASVALSEHQQYQSTISVVDDKDPLLAFSEDGERLDSGSTLRGSVVWLLYPGEVIDLVVDGDMRVVAEGVLPPGWAGWNLRLVDLAGVSSLGSKQSQRVHRVQGRDSVRIVTGEPLQGLRSRTGEPVFSAAPEIILPDGFNSAAVWTVTVVGPDGELLVEHHPIRQDADTAELWDQVPRPLLGRYGIRVRGPWGRGASREVFVAEGVTLQSNPSWRRISTGGLVPAAVRLHSRAGLTLEHSLIRLSEDEVEQRAQASAPGRTVPLHVCPPHMTMSYQSMDASTVPSVRQIPLQTENVLRNPGILTIDLQGVGAPVIHVIVGSSPIQRLEPMRMSRGGIYRFDLSKMTDTLATHSHARLSLDEAGTLAVATVSPKALFSEVQLHDGVLHFMDAPAVEGMVAVIYSTTAPWRAGSPHPVISGQVPLPLAFLDAGPMLVHVRIDDPWVPTPVPAWPSRENADWVDAPGWFRGDSEAELRLSRWLAGSGPFPYGEAEHAWTWAITARLSQLRLLDRFAEVSTACAQDLRADPSAALQDLDAVHADPDRLPEVLVRSGLLSRPTELTARRAQVQWSQAMSIPAALLSGPRLVRERHEDTDQLSSMRLVCGDVTEHLVEGTDPYATVGHFDHFADRYDKLSQQDRLEAMRMISLVPQGLLDQDSRTLAAFELLDNRRKAAKALLGQAGESLEGLEALLTSTNDLPGLAALRARQHPTRRDGWRVLPALSIGWAWMARRAARHGGESRWAKSQIALWGHLAAIAPRLVTIDVVLAELLVAADQTDQTQEAQ